MAVAVACYQLIKAISTTLLKESENLVMCKFYIVKDKAAMLEIRKQALACGLEQAIMAVEYILNYEIFSRNSLALAAKMKCHLNLIDQLISDLLKDQIIEIIELA